MTTTELLIVATVAVVSVYTWVASRNDAPGDTVSETMRRWARRWWVIPPAWFALAGHWWGPVMPEWWPTWTDYVLGLLGVGGVVLGALDWRRVSGWWVWWILGAVGAVLGAVLWPLSRGG
jgi:hypothetical protein